MNLLELARSAIRERTEPAEAPARATPEQATELRRLVPEVCRLTNEADPEGALAIALADPEAALTSYRALLAELTEPTADATSCDDRRPCAVCANFSPGGLCIAAWRGVKIGNAGREYHPAYPEQPRRCVGYRPGLNDNDQRSGAERWPEVLTQLGSSESHDH